MILSSIAASAAPPTRAEGISFYFSKDGYCRLLPKSSSLRDQDSRPDLSKLSLDEKNYQARLEEETCKIELLKVAVSKDESGFCAQFSETTPFACFLAAIKKIHEKEPLSTTGVILASANEASFANREFKIEKMSNIDLAANDLARKSLESTLQSLAMLQTRVHARDWLGNDAVDIEQRDQDGSQQFCQRLVKEANRHLLYLEKKSKPELIEDWKKQLKKSSC
jgi:hypothetical protein